MEQNKEKQQDCIDLKLKVAEALLKIKHENIQQLIKYEYVGVFLYVFEYVDMSEADIGCLEGEALVRAVKQVCSAVQCLHDHKIIHHDVKRRNLLFTKDLDVKLCDFGLAVCTEGGVSDYEVHYISGILHLLYLHIYQGIVKAMKQATGEGLQTGNTKMSLEDISNNCLCWGPELFGDDAPATLDTRTDVWGIAFTALALAKPGFGFKPGDIIALFKRTTEYN